MYENEMEDCLVSNAIYTVVPKSKWIGFFVNEQYEFYDKKDIQTIVRDQINDIGKGIMLVELDGESLDIIQKYIVAPLRWPRL
jgi:hypothetical protein